MKQAFRIRTLGVVLFGITGSLTAGFAGCGGGGTSGSGSTSTSSSAGGGGAGTTGTTTTSATASSTASSTTATTSAGGGGSGAGTTASSTGAGGAAACASCTVIAMLPSGSAPYGLAVDDNNVYWTNSGSNEVMQAKADGSSPVTLATEQHTPYAVHVAGGSVYWTSYSVEGVIRKTPVGGGPITDLALAPATRDFALGTSYIWWTYESDDLGRIPIDGLASDAGVPLLLSGNNLPNGIVADATNVYWINRDGYINRADLNLENYEVIGAAKLPWDIQVDATSFYWTDMGEKPNTGKVMMAPKANWMSTVTVATGQASPQGLAVDATSVYWANKDDGTIHKAPIGGGADTVLAGGQMAPANVAVDATHVYWTDPKANRVVRVAK